MWQDWTIIVMGKPGHRPRRVALTRSLVAGFGLVCALSVAAGVWAGWQIGEATSVHYVAGGEP